MNPAISFRALARIAALSALVACLPNGSSLSATEGKPAMPLPLAAPREAGFSPERLERLHVGLCEFVDDGRCSGFVTLLARHGRIVDWHAHGQRDLEARSPMETDTIVWLYSNSKLIVSVGAMILVEEGRLDLNAPVAKYLPGLGDLRVLVGGTADEPQLVEPATPPRIRDLLTHTSGLTYGYEHDVADEIFHRVNVWAAGSMDEFVSRVAKVPLAFQPGTQFRYGISTDVLGAVIEKVSGQNLEDFLQARVLRPLGMVDTTFYVPAEKWSRVAKVYRHAPDGRLVRDPATMKLPERGRGFPSAGGGLFSTAGDCVRFGQMLLNGGELDGVRILGRKTVEYMTRNHLVRTAKPTHAYSQSRGFGLGAEVVIEPARDPYLCSPGQFGWSGYASTYLQIDPTENLVAIALFQHTPMNEYDMFGRFANGYSTALVDAGARHLEADPIAAAR